MVLCEPLAYERVVFVTVCLYYMRDRMKDSKGRWRGSEKECYEPIIVKWEIGRVLHGHPTAQLVWKCSRKRNWWVINDCAVFWQRSVSTSKVRACACCPCQLASVACVRLCVVRIRVCVRAGGDGKISSLINVAPMESGRLLSVDRVGRYYRSAIWIWYDLRPGPPI